MPEARRSTTALVLSLAVFGVLAAAIASYTLDDTFIYLQFARNAAAGRGLSFNASHPTFGFTSPLWLAILTAGEWLGVNALVWAKAVSIALGAASVVTFWTLAHRLLADERAAAVATLLWSQNAWLIRWSVTGMETALAVLLLLVALNAFTRGHSRRHAAVTGVALGLLALVRPEAIVVLPLSIAARFGTRTAGTRTLTWSWLASLCAGYLLAVLPWAVFAAVYFGSVLPTTALAKSAPGISVPAMLSRVERIALILGAVVAAELILVAWWLARAASRRAQALPLFPLLILVVLPGVFVATNAVVVSRYLLPVIPVAILLGIGSIVAAVPPARRTPLLVAVAVLGILQNQYVFWGVARPEAEQFTAGLRGCFQETGRWLRDNTPPGTLVAVGDIGAVGYESDRPVLDMEGLVSPEFVALRRRVSRDEIVRDRLYLQFAKPAYVIDGPSSESNRLPAYDTPPHAVPVFSCRTDSLGVALAGEFHYTLYRLDYASGPPGL